MTPKALNNELTSPLGVGVLWKMKKPFIVGISGGSGSGKTTFLNKLVDNIGKSNVCLVSLDHYYKTKEQQVLDENGITNYDRPESIDLHAFASDLNTLSEGIEVNKMEYDFNNPAIERKLLTFKPSPVILIEGIFLFSYETLADKIDFRLFIDTHEHLRIKRRILRDLTERGYPLDETLYYIENHVTPGYIKYVEPHRQNADMIIPNHKNFDKAIEALGVFLKSKI